MPQPLQPTTPTPNLDPPPLSSSLATPPNHRPATQNASPGGVLPHRVVCCFSPPQPTWEGREQARDAHQHEHKERKRKAQPGRRADQYWWEEDEKGTCERRVVAARGNESWMRRKRERKIIMEDREAPTEERGKPSQEKTKSN